MTITVAQKILVVLTIPPSLEEPIVDWLLEKHKTGFTSQPVSGHSNQLEGLSPAEQVAGRRRRVQFQIELNTNAVDSFLESAASEFDGADIHYRVVPILAAGHLVPSAG